MSDIRKAKQVTVVADDDTLQWLYDRAVDIFEDDGILSVRDEKDVMYNMDTFEVVPENND